MATVEPGSRQRLLSCIALAAVLLLCPAPVRGEDTDQPAGDQVPETKTEEQAAEIKIPEKDQTPASQSWLPLPAGVSHTSAVPVPEIILDPNEGDTLGVMGVLMLLDDKDEIRYMLAPDIRYNKTKGVFPTFRLFGYPSPTRRYSVAVGKSTTKDQNYEVEYADRGLWDQRAFLLAHLGYEADSTERFFGFGNDSLESNESNYTSEEFLAEATPGLFIWPHLSVSYRMRVRRFALSHGQVDSEPFINARRFRRNPETNIENRGLDPGVYWSHRLTFAYDTRDSLDMPTQGALSLIYVDVADRRLGSATSYVKFGFESRGFIPFREVKNPILALRMLADYVSGSSDTPFWEMSTLGGRRTLRGYGSDRFTDFNRALGSAELRTRVYQHKLFGVNAELELAPFLEAGQVFNKVTTSPIEDLHWVYGLGFRGRVRPQIVCFVDVGTGSEGASIFTGIDYPF